MRLKLGIYIYVSVKPIILVVAFYMKTSEMQLLFCYLLGSDSTPKQLTMLQPQTEDWLRIFTLSKHGWMPAQTAQTVDPSTAKLRCLEQQESCFQTVLFLKAFGVLRWDVLCVSLGVWHADNPRAGCSAGGLLPPNSTELSHGNQGHSLLPPLGMDLSVLQVVLTALSI